MNLLVQDEHMSGSIVSINHPNTTAHLNNAVDYIHPFKAKVYNFLMVP